MDSQSPVYLDLIQPLYYIQKQTSLVKSSLVKLETSHAVIIPLMVINYTLYPMLMSAVSMDFFIILRASCIPFSSYNYSIFRLH